MTTIEQKIAELDLILPETSKPLAAYIPAVQSGNLVFTSGQLPMVNGSLKTTGKVGSDVSAEEAKELAQLCALNALAAIKMVIGDLEKIKRVVKVVAFISSTPDFIDQPSVANGASEFLGAVLGDRGVHARSAVGVAVLPLDAPVEVELIVEI
ncbi:MAG: RidA family protein [Actinomycetota bacterium]